MFETLKTSKKKLLRGLKVASRGDSLLFLSTKFQLVPINPINSYYSAWADLGSNAFDLLEYDNGT